MPGQLKTILFTLFLTGIVPSSPAAGQNYQRQFAAPAGDCRIRLDDHMLAHSPVDWSGLALLDGAGHPVSFSLFRGTAPAEAEGIPSTVLYFRMDPDGHRCQALIKWPAEACIGQARFFLTPATGPVRGRLAGSADLRTFRPLAGWPGDARPDASGGWTIELKGVREPYWRLDLEADIPPVPRLLRAEGGNCSVWICLENAPSPRVLVLRYGADGPPPAARAPLPELNSRWQAAVILEPGPVQVPNGWPGFRPDWRQLAGWLLATLSAVMLSVYSLRLFRHLRTLKSKFQRRPPGKHL